MATTKLKLRSIRDLKTPNFAVMAAMSPRQLRLVERWLQLEAATKKTLGKRIGAREWLRAIENERARRGAA